MNQAETKAQSPALLVGLQDLQWSRLMNQAETALRKRRQRQPQGSSMEPPDESGGDRDQAAPERLGAERLQWSRLMNQAETPFL